jgi:xanthine/uracil/vitamin C permease (AzgA family)
MLDRIFNLSGNNTTIGTEILAGATTFLTMSYIVLVNPQILAAAGMDKAAVFVATCLASAGATLIMALYANYPLALAPEMGLNAYFAFTVVKGMHYPWEVTLGNIKAPTALLAAAGFGFITYTAAKLISGRLRDVNPALIALSILFIVKYGWF